MSSVATNPAVRNERPMSEPSSGELVKTDRTPPVITTADEYQASLARWQQRQYHILTPFSNISGLASSHGILTSVVQINTDTAAGEIYDGLPFLKKDKGEVALAKNGLRKIAEGLGISTKLEYLSVGPIRHYWHIKAIASYRGIDGSIVTREASMEWDLRDGSDRLKGWTGNQISEARKHGVRACETRALNAAIRECGCGIKQAYRRDELARPFVAIRVMHQPDMSDPEIKRMVTERALQGTSALYAGAAAPRAAHTLDYEPEPSGASAPRSIGSGSTANATAPATPAATAPQLPDGTVLVKALEVKQMARKPPKTGTFPKWVVTDSNGEVHVTIQREFGETLQKCFEGKRPLEIVSDVNGFNENEISELLPAPDPNQPSLLAPSGL